MNYRFKTFQKGAALKQKLNGVEFFHLLKDRIWILVIMGMQQWFHNW